MIFRVVRAFSRLMARSLAPARSLTWAPVTTTDSSQPSASTAACRPLPLIFFPPWNPRLSLPPVSAALPVWGSAVTAARPLPAPGPPPPPLLMGGVRRIRRPPVTAQASGRGATAGAAARERVDRHQGLLAQDGLRHLSRTRSPLTFPADTPDVTRSTRVTPATSVPADLYLQALSLVAREEGGSCTVVLVLSFFLAAGSPGMNARST